MAGDLAVTQRTAAGSWVTAVVAVLAGVVLLAWPAPTLLVFSQLAGWSMGVIGFLRAIEATQEGRFRSLAFATAVGIAAVGVALSVWPGRTILVATVLAGTWLVVDGGSRVLATAQAVSARDEVVGNLLGAAELLFGILVIARPISGVKAAAVFAGLGLLALGAAHTFEAIRPRS